MLNLVGCSHHRSSVDVRERLAFRPDQTAAALRLWGKEFPAVEAVLVSTCNRVEFYSAARDGGTCPSWQVVAQFLADFHQIPADDVRDALFRKSGEKAIRHLFTVAASLDSMVVGEPQILAQVKEAYRLAQDQQSTGPLTHHAFQSALRVARRVAKDTSLFEGRVSIPSVAVADFASQIFETFEDKEVLVLGAGEMAEETLRYLRDAGAQRITVVNRSPGRACELAGRWDGTARNWEQRFDACVAADLVISTTGGSHPIVTLADYQHHIGPLRFERPLMILDLAMPRDIDPSVGDLGGVYLYSIDDLSEACQANRAQRDKEIPTAMRIVEEETCTHMAQSYHRATAPIIAQLRKGWDEPKQRELDRLYTRLPDLDDQAREEIARSFDRLVNKLLHPPLESLRTESQEGTPHGLLDALRKLFYLKG